MDDLFFNYTGFLTFGRFIEEMGIHMDVMKCTCSLAMVFCLLWSWSSSVYATPPSPRHSKKPQVCTPKSYVCDGMFGRKQCSDDGLYWKASVSCGVRNACTNGVCRRQQCTPNSSRCDGMFKQQQCSNDGLDWQASVSCGGNHYCENGTCRRQQCQPGSWRCPNRHHSEVCDSNGSSSSRIYCRDDQVCEPSNCRPKRTNTIHVQVRARAIGRRYSDSSSHVINIPDGWELDTSKVTRYPVCSVGDVVPGIHISECHTNGRQHEVPRCCNVKLQRENHNRYKIKIYAGCVSLWGHGNWCISNITAHLKERR